MRTGTKALTANTAATLDFDKPTQAVLLSSSSTAVVYGLINWVTGDSEVSSSNFHFIIKIGDNIRLGFDQFPTLPIDNVRLITSASSAIGYVSE